MAKELLNTACSMPPPFEKFKNVEIKNYFIFNKAIQAGCLSKFNDNDKN